jgi:hypothetical protein
MHYPTGAATTTATLAPECALQEGPNYLASANVLRDTEVEVIADYFNQGPSLLLIGDHVELDEQEPSRFVQYPHFDVFLFLIARDVQSALQSRVGVKRFYIPNNEDSTGAGLHWVSVVYEIRQKRDASDYNRLRRRNSAHVGTSGDINADFEHELIDASGLEGTSLNDNIPGVRDRSSNSVSGYEVSASTTSMFFWALIVTYVSMYTFLLCIYRLVMRSILTCGMFYLAHSGRRIQLMY